MTLHRFTSSYLFAHLSTSWCIVVLLCLYTSLCPFLYAHLHTSLYVRLSLYIFVCTPLSLNLFLSTSPNIFLHISCLCPSFYIFVHPCTSSSIFILPLWQAALLPVIRCLQWPSMLCFRLSQATDTSGPERRTCPSKRSTVVKRPRPLPGPAVESRSSVFTLEHWTRQRAKCQTERSGKIDWWMNISKWWTSQSKAWAKQKQETFEAWIGRGF